MKPKINVTNLTTLAYGVPHLKSISVFVSTFSPCRSDLRGLAIGKVKLQTAPYSKNNNNNKGQVILNKFI